MKPLLSLAMMVKNEEDFLEEALESAKPWVDEMVVVDTGSTDRTVEIAKDLGATVSYFEWPNSFSLARNETLRRATGEWVFILDADERIKGDEPEKLRSQLVPGKDFPFEALLLNVVNVSANGAPISSTYGPRVFPRHEKLGYHGRVHNTFQSLDPQHPNVKAHFYHDAEIIHLGYDEEIYKNRKKAERSLPLILASLEDNPEDGAMHFYLGREYLRIDQPAKAIPSLIKAIDKITTSNHHTNLLESAWLSLINASRASDAPLHETMTFASNALKIFPTNSDLWHATAGVLIKAEKSAEALNCLLQAKKHLSTGWVSGAADQSLAFREWEIDEKLALVYGETGQWQESYKMFLRTIETRPRHIPGWDAIVEATTQIAEQLGDTENLERLRLLAKASE